MDEYLTVEELSKKIKYSKRTLYNYINLNKFIKGVHYIKPSRKKILFIWPAIKEWLGDTTCLSNPTALNESPQAISAPVVPAVSTPPAPVSRINI